MDAHTVALLCRGFVTVLAAADTPTPSLPPLRMPRQDLLGHAQFGRLDRLLESPELSQQLGRGRRLGSHRSEGGVDCAEVGGLGHPWWRLGRGQAGALGGETLVSVLDFLL